MSLFKKFIFVFLINFISLGLINFVAANKTLALSHLSETISTNSETDSAIPMPQSDSTPTSPTPTPSTTPITTPPVSTATPASSVDVKLGVNFWHHRTNEIFNPTLGPDGKRGYVLFLNNRDHINFDALENDEVDIVRHNDHSENIQTAVNANLIPMIRFDYRTGVEAVPIPGTAEYDEWLQAFKELIDKYYVQGARLFIVSNEPGLEGEIEVNTYAQVYVDVWNLVHGTNGGTYQDVELLVAGQNFHTLDTVQWIANVSNSVSQIQDPTGTKPSSEQVKWIDGYAIHTYGYGNLPEGQRLAWRYKLEEGKSPEEAHLICDDPSGCQRCFDHDGNEQTACIVQSCPSPSDPSLQCDGLGDTWDGDDSFQNFADQVRNIPEPYNEKPIYITEFNTYGAGGNTTDGNTIPSNNYPTDWIEDTLNAVEAANDPRIKALIWFTGAPSGNIDNSTDHSWDHFSLLGRNIESSRLDQAKEDFCESQRQGSTDTFECVDVSGIGHLNNGLLLEEFVSIDNKNFDPGVYAFWNWIPFEYPVSLDIYTFPIGGSSLSNRLQTFDLNDPDTPLINGGLPQNPLAAALRVADVPDQAVRWQMVLTDRFGETATSIFEYDPSSQPPCSGCGPGGDNPDDNFSAASVAANTASIPHQAATEAPLQRRQTPRIAVLDRGFQYDTINLLAELGEPAIPVAVDFSPMMVETLPVLLIPTGALMGLGDSALFQARLEAYAEAGGTIIVFAQQRGADFGILPGSELSAFGWDEDVSCFWQGYYISANHPIVSGFDSDQVSITNDGYFTVWPEEAEIILSRTRNGQPAALIYPYGQGQVFATTAYFDWGQTLNQISPDSQILMRDLLTWATQPEYDLTTAPGIATTIPVTIANPTEFNVVAIKVDLIDPARGLVETRTTRYYQEADWVEAAPITPLSPRAYHQAVYGGDAIILFSDNQTWLYQ